jgi:hypothetical protein
MWFVPPMLEPVDGIKDSKESQQGFESILGYPPQTGISELQYRVEGLNDKMILMRFRCSDATVIAKIVETLELKNMTEAKSELPAPAVKWWKRAGSTRFTLYGAEYDNLFRYLWVDEKRGIVFFQEVSV